MSDGPAAALLTVAWRGLRVRSLLATGSLVLTVIAVAAAVVGPMYQDAAARSYLVAALRNAPVDESGMTLDYTPRHGQSIAQAEAEAADRSAARLGAGFARPRTSVWSVTNWAADLGPNGGQPTLLSESGACAHVGLTGRCPTRPGQILMLRHDAAYLGLHVGDSFTPWGGSTTLTVVGTYVPRASDTDFWFDPSRLESIAWRQDLESHPTPLNPGGNDPYRPAPFITPTSTFGLAGVPGWDVRSDVRLLVGSGLTVDGLLAVNQRVGAILRGLSANFTVTGPGTLVPELGTTLPAIAHQAVRRRDTARSTVSPAVFSLVLVALLLLFRLLSAAMDRRRLELALASLRGFSTRRMWFLGLVEPLIVVVVATPVGLVAGYLSVHWLIRRWLVPGLPVRLGWASVGAGLLVAALALAAAVVVVRSAVREPLSVQIAGVRRPGGVGRWVLVAQATLVAAALLVLVATLARSGQSSPDATDLLLPILLAAAAGVVTSLAARRLAGLWARQTARRRGLFGFIASRTIARRREGTLVILPLTASLAVAIFAAGVFTAAAAWRASEAATLVGADRSFSTGLSLGRAIALTHRLDPQGRWLMAIGANYAGRSQRLVVDAPRLARVADWPGTWTRGLSASQVARELEPRRPSVVVTGSRVTMTMDNRVRGQYAGVSLDLELHNSLGGTSGFVIGPFASGVSTRTARVPGCTGGCLLQTMTIGGPGAVSEAMHGSVSITRFDVDGRPVAHALTLPWRTVRPGLQTPQGVAGAPRVVRGALDISFDSAGYDSLAEISPTDVPAAWPVLWGRTAAPAAQRTPGAVTWVPSGGVTRVAVRSVGSTESMPVLGPSGFMVDYTMFDRGASAVTSFTQVHILARADTPSSVIGALAARGMTQSQSLAAARHTLDQDAFALALKLYVVVTVIVILLAFAGLGANLAVQMPTRRRDAAALRVVGVRRRSVVAGAVAELAAVLGAAAVAGVLAGALAQYVVVRTVTLGYADSAETPRLLATFDLTGTLRLLGLTVAALLVVSLAVAALAIRGGRASTLREESR